MAFEPWYTIVAEDLFPEESTTFLLPLILIRKEFAKLQGDLFDTDYWKELQKLIQEGQMMEFSPSKTGTYVPSWSLF